MNGTVGVQIGNFVKTTISSSINGSTTSIPVASVSGFPSISVPTTWYFYLTIIRISDSAKEIVKVTDYTGTTLTVVRAQESTTGLALVAGDRVELNLTASTMIDLITELGSVYAAYNLITANYTSLSIPAAALIDNILALRHIPDLLITGAKLNAAVAGDGLEKDASGNLQIKSSATIIISGDAPIVAPASIGPTQMVGGNVVSFVSPPVAGSTAAGIVYEGVIPHAGIHGNAGSGFREVYMVIGNSHVTEDLIIGVRVGSSLNYYLGTGSDTGVSVYTGIRIKNTTFWAAGSNTVPFKFSVPPGYFWMVENENGTQGTPVIVSHNYWEYR